jgi:hypothetical protein
MSTLKNENLENEEQLNTWNSPDEIYDENLYPHSSPQDLDNFGEDIPPPIYTRPTDIEQIKLKYFKEKNEQETRPESASDSNDLDQISDHPKTKNFKEDTFLPSKNDLNGQDIKLESASESNDLDEEEYCYVTEKFTYNFEFPNQTQPGYVHVENDKIVLLFPEPSSTYVPKYPHTQTVQFFLNRQVVFDYQWLPIYSLNDFYRVKDMIAKSFQEYSNKTYKNNFLAPKTICCNTKYFEEMFTICETKHFYLSCIEDVYTSSIILDLKAISKLFPTLNSNSNSNSNPMPFSESNLNPMHVQIFIGSNLIFSTHRDLLPFLDTSMIHFVTQFILYKLLKL